jgi:hypothetical protein
MLYTIKQLKRGVDSLVVSGFAKNPSQVDRDLKNLDNKGVGNYIKQNAETVKNYFNSLNSDENKQFLHIREVFGSNGNTRV